MPFDLYNKLGETLCLFFTSFKPVIRETAFLLTPIDAKKIINSSGEGNCHLMQENGLVY